MKTIKAKISRRGVFSETQVLIFCCCFFKISSLTVTTRGVMFHFFFFPFPFLEKTGEETANCDLFLSVIMYFGSFLSRFRFNDLWLWGLLTGISKHKKDSKIMCSSSWVIFFIPFSYFFSKYKKFSRKSRKNIFLIISRRRNCWYLSWYTIMLNFG